MHRRRLRRRVEHRPELVVQRPGSFRERDVLRDPSQVRALCEGEVEARRELRRELGHIGAEHRNEPAGEQQARHLVEMLFWRLGRRRRMQRNVLTEDRRV